MSEVELREQIVTINLPEWNNEDACRCDFCLEKANKRTAQILNLIKQAGYLPVEPVKLEVLGEEEIEEYAKEEGARGYPIKSGWLTDEIMVHVKDIVQANIAHNEAKGQLYREVKHG